MQNKKGYGSPYELALSGASLIFALVTIKIILSGGAVSPDIMLAFSSVVMATALISLAL